MPKIHCSPIPLTLGEIRRTKAFSPHEIYHLPKSAKGRFSAGLLFVKETLLYPIQTPFWMLMNTALLIKKAAKLIFNFVALISFTKKRWNEVKVLSKETLDYLCLLPLLPLTRLVVVIRKLAAAIIHPGIYYRRPNLCTKEQQALYYQKQTEELFQKLFRKNGLSKESKREIWSLKKQMKRRLQREGTFDDKIILAKACALAVSSLNEKITERRLLEFKAFLA